MLDEQECRRLVARRRRHVQRCAPPLGREVDVRASGHQQGDDIVVPSRDRPVQGRKARTISLVRISTLVEQLPSALDIAALRRILERTGTGRGRRR
jgi:hypothetical protein